MMMMEVATFAAVRFAHDDEPELIIAMAVVSVQAMTIHFAICSVMQIVIMEPLPCDAIDLIVHAWIAIQIIVKLVALARVASFSMLDNAAQSAAIAVGSLMNPKFEYEAREIVH